MTEYFGDASYFVARLNPRDQWHSSAMAFTPDTPSHLITTRFVLIEVCNSMARGANRRTVMNWLRDSRTDRSIQIVPADEMLVEMGTKLFLDRTDKDWSLTDCISFVVMEQRGLRTALTTDRHF